MSASSPFPASRHRGVPPPGRSKSARDAARQSAAAVRAAVSSVLLAQLGRFATAVEDASDRHARRERARAHGSRLSQCAGSDDDERENRDDEDGGGSDGTSDDPPLRIELCLARGSVGSYRSAFSQGPSSPQKAGRGGAKGKKGKQPHASALLAEAQERISEPLYLLLASSAAVISPIITLVPQDRNLDMDEGAVAELRENLIRLRKRVASSSLDSYLSQCEEDKEEQTSQANAINVLSTCLLIASVAETMLGMAGSNEENKEAAAKKTEGLFRLRSDAVAKAVTAMSTSLPKKKTKKQKKKNTNSQRDENPSQEDEFIDGKGSSTSEASQSTLDKSRKLVEEALADMVPNPSLEFLAGSLRTYGVTSGERNEEVGVACTNRQILVASQIFEVKLEYVFCFLHFSAELFLSL